MNDDEERLFIRNWIYSYLKYGGLLTEEQREKVKSRFKKDHSVRETPNNLNSSSRKRPSTSNLNDQNEEESE